MSELPITRRRTLSLLGASMLNGRAAASAPLQQVRTQFGVNVYGLLLHGLQPGGSSGTTTLKTLGRSGIPFVRFAASGQWAADWAQFEADPKRHWAALDSLFAAAEQNGVKLVPSVLWNTAALAFHSGEPMQAWTDPASRTRQLAHRYTTAFVDRYDRSSALMMYEFANELNDWVDLPNVLKFWPKRDPTEPGRAPQEKDRLTSLQLRTFTQEFASTVRKNSSKPIGMGSNVPRWNAWNLARGRWDADSPYQFIEQFRAMTPSAMNVLSMHIYERQYEQPNSIFAALPDLLKAFVEAADLDKRITFLGEFGVPRDADRINEKRRFYAMLETISHSCINYAALWNYSDQSFQKDWDISVENDRSYQLDLIVQANKGL